MLLCTFSTRALSLTKPPRLVSLPRIDSRAVLKAVYTTLETLALSALRVVIVFTDDIGARCAGGWVLSGTAHADLRAGRVWCYFQCLRRWPCAQREKQNEADCNHLDCWGEATEVEALKTCTASGIGRMAPDQPQLRSVMGLPGHRREMNKATQQGKS